MVLVTSTKVTEVDQVKGPLSESKTVAISPAVETCGTIAAASFASQKMVFNDYNPALHTFDNDKLSSSSNSTSSSSTGFTPSDASINYVNTFCKSIIDVPGCRVLVPEAQTKWLDACIQDALKAGSFVYSELHRQAFNANCASKARYAIDSYDPVKALAAKQVQDLAGYEGNSCPASCSNHGTCGGNGCACSNGWTGGDCSISLKSLKDIVDQSTGKPYNLATVFDSSYYTSVEVSRRSLSSCVEPNPSTDPVLVSGSKRQAMASHRVIVGVSIFAILLSLF